MREETAAEQATPASSAVVLVAVISLTLLALELAWTRVFSAEFFYTFAFLVLSLALLGLGLGALAVHLVPRCGRPEMLPLLLSLTGLAALAGPPLAFGLGLDFAQLAQSAGMVARLVAVIILLGAAYFFGGMALAALFRQESRHLDRLYAADLVGAGLGVLAIVPVMDGLGTPAATFACAFPVLAAAVVTARRWFRLVPAALLAVMLGLGARGEDLLVARRQKPAPVVSTHWDSVAKITIYERGPEHRGLNIDNAANSPVYRFDGNWNRPDSLRFQFGIDVNYLIGLFDACTFLSLGAGGGSDVLQALQAGAAEIHAVEVIPYVNELMVSGDLAEYTGHIYRDPRVIVVTEDARAYVRRHPGKFDLIYSLSSNTFAALASGAFALAENYLFTTEAFQDYWLALTDRGFMMMEHQFYMPRLVSAIIDALGGLGVGDPAAHFAVYDLPAMRRNMVLISRRPLTPEITNHAFGELSPAVAEHIQLLYPPPAGGEDNLINRIVVGGWQEAQSDTPIDLSPSTDDRPFAAQLGRWRNFSWPALSGLSPLAEVKGFPLAKLLIVTILLVVMGLVVPLNLLPYAATRGPRLRAGPWLYFGAIGFAFMAVEVILIQRYTLFIGPSTLSFTTILLTLLVASGLGSASARRVPDAVAFAGIIAWLLLEIVFWRRATGALASIALPARLAVTALLVAPLGFFMGMPFPKAGLRVGELIPWGFAVNGAASVLGATAIMLIAFARGYDAALLLAAAIYAFAYLLLARKRVWEERTAGEVRAINRDTLFPQPASALSPESRLD